MYNIYIIINNYIFDVTEFSNSIYNTVDIKKYHLQDATNNLIMKHENDDMFLLFNYVIQCNNYLGIKRICKNVFLKNIPDYFIYFFDESDLSNYVKNMINNSYILFYKMDNLFQFTIKINNEIYNLNIIFISKNWCYYSKKGVINFENIEDLIHYLINNNFEKMLMILH